MVSVSCAVGGMFGIRYSCGFKGILWCRRMLYVDVAVGDKLIPKGETHDNYGYEYSFILLFISTSTTTSYPTWKAYDTHRQVISSIDVSYHITNQSLPERYSMKEIPKYLSPRKSEHKRPTGP